MKRRTLVTDHGIELTYRVVDDGGDGRASIVLCGGLGGTHLVWSALVSRLRKRHRILMWDYPGLRGGFAKRDVPVDVPSLASYLIHLIDALAIVRPCLVGWSLGPQVALEIERTRPGFACAIVAVCGVAAHPFADDVEREPIAAALGVRSAVPEAVGWLSSRLDSIERLKSLLGRLEHPTRWAARLGFVDPRIDDLIFDAVIRDFLDMDPSVYARYVRAAAEHDALDVLDDLGVPLLAVAGERDRLVPSRRVKEMADRVQGAQFLEARGATHFLPLEYPDLLAVAIEEFLDNRLSR